MALPTSAVLDLNSRTRSGIILGISPSTGAAWRVEVRRSTQSSTASTNWQSFIFDPSSANYRTYTMELPLSTRTFFFQARHILLGYDPSSWSSMISAKPQLIPPALKFPRRGEGFNDGKFALRATEKDGATKVSDAFVLQGSMLPFVSPLPGTFFSYASGGPAAAQMWISFGWTSQTLYRPDGTTATVPAPPAAPSAPSLSQVAGGVRGALTLFARIAYLKTDPITGHETLYPVSAESSFAVSANNLLKITSPSNPGGSLYDGWAALVGSVTNTEYVQGVTAKINFGTDYTEPAGHFSTTQNSLWTASWKSLTKIGLDPSTTYKHYPYSDIAKNVVYIPADTTNTNAQLAALQNGDGTLSLGQYSSGFTGVISITTPAAASTGSGNAGGGRLM